MTQAEDDEDVPLAVTGDAAAFERLYRRHAPRLHSLARRLLGRTGADDATQEVFLRAWSKLATFRGESAFSTWIHRLAINVCLRRAEDAHCAIESRVVDLDALRAPAPTQEMQLDLVHALDRLSPAVRHVVVLFDLEGYSHDEIATLMGISVASSKMRLLRGRAALRALLFEGRA